MIQQARVFHPTEHIEAVEQRVVLFLEILHADVATIHTRDGHQRTDLSFQRDGTGTHLVGVIRFQ
ncbi:hypothetical protein D3C86_1198420 [compost metagenome]